MSDVPELWGRARALRVVLAAAERVAVLRGWDPILSSVVDYIAVEYTAVMERLAAGPPALETPGAWTEQDETRWRAIVAAYHRTSRRSSC